MEFEKDIQASVVQSQNKEGRLINSVTSEFYERYQKQISGDAFDKVKAEINLAEHNIRYNPNQYYDFQYEIQQVILDYHILKVHLKLGHFQMNIYVLNQAIDNPLINFQLKKFGKFGQVYFIQQFNQNLAIKSVKIKTSQNFGSVIEQILKQVAILKICSIIGCSVKYGKYLGFDLIVYKDCIQFAMMKGKQEVQKQQMVLLKKLKCQLALMHSFSIVHCDIKPENIIFCQSQNKFVFIDFGFAEVVKEKLGFKSKTHYKGSPQYSSLEMMSIIVSERQEYIDLYFNDIFSLIKSIQNKLEEDYEQDQNIKFQVQNKITASILCHYMINAFKFYYLFQNITKLNDILNYNNQFLAKRSSKQLLLFIKLIYQKIFIPQIFYQHFNCYEIADQYKCIQKLTELSNDMIIIQTIVKDNEKSVQQNQFFRRYIETGIKNNYLYDKSINYHLIYDYFLKNNLTNKLLDFKLQQTMFTLLIQCLSFDKFNIDFEKKTKLAAISNFFLSSNYKPSIQDIKIVFRKIADNIFKPQLTKWKFQKGFDVFYQLIILEIDFSERLFKYILEVKTKYNTIEDKFILAMEMKNLSSLISFKCISSFNRSLFILRNFLNKQENKLLQEIMILNPKNQLQISLCILSKSTLNYILMTYQQEKLILSVLDKIQNQKLVRLIKNIMTINKIISLFNNRYCDDIFHKIKFLLKQQYKNQNLMRLFTFTSEFLFFFLCFQQLRQLQSSIKAMFGCQQVYKTFKIQYYTFLYNKQDKNQQNLRKYLQQLLQSFQILKQMKSMDMKIFNEIYFLLLKIKDNPTFQRQNQQIIQQIYVKFVCQTCNSNSKKQIYNFFLCNLEIEFLSIIPCYFDYFRIKLKQISQHCQVAHQAYLNDPSEEKKLNCSNFEYTYLMYRQFQILFQCNEQEYLKHLLLLQKKGSELFGQLIAKQKNCLAIISLMIKTKKMQLASNYIDQVEACLVRDGSYGFYLYPRKRQLLKLILNFHLQRRSLKKIYELLKNLIKWILNHPSKIYLSILIINLKLIFKIDMSMFKYSSLEQNIQDFRQKAHDNPYYLFLIIYSIQEEKLQSKRIKMLKMITLRFNQLTAFARRYLMVYYYVFMIKLETISLRKKVFLIKFSRNFIKKKFKYLLTANAIKYQRLILMKNAHSKLNNACSKKLIQNVRQILA